MCERNEIRVRYCKGGGVREPGVDRGRENNIHEWGDNRVVQPRVHVTLSMWEAHRREMGMVVCSARVSTGLRSW